MKKVVEEINRVKDAALYMKQAESLRGSLKINWATNPEKMEFEKLHSGAPNPRLKISRMDKIKVESGGYKELFYPTLEDVVRMWSLIEMVNRGEEIIPPMYSEYVVYVDGVRTVRGLERIDGSHRMRLAEYLGLNEIPIVVLEGIQSYIFTIDKWSFEEKTITEEKPGNRMIERRVIQATSIDGEVVVLGGGQPRLNNGVYEEFAFPDYVTLRLD